MVNEERLGRIKELLTWRQLSKSEAADDDIGDLLAEAFDELAGLTTYEDTRIWRFWLLDFSEEHHDMLFASLFILQKRQMRSLGAPAVIPTPEDDVGHVDYRPLGEYLTELAHTLTARQSPIRLSEDVPLLSEISEGMRRGLLSMVIQIVQHDCVDLQWRREDFRATVLLLAVGRQLARMTGRLHLFYGLLGVVIDRLNLSNEYQLCRDFAEEVLLTSFADDRREWGYFLLFKASNGQNNANLALMYANVCIALIRSKRAVEVRLFKLLMFELQRYYRNIRFTDESKVLYRFMIDHLPLDQYEVFDVTSTHLTTLLSEGDASMVVGLYEYLSDNREFIFRGGKSVALPLLNTIYNASNVFREHPDVGLLEAYVPALEAMANPDDAARLRTLAFGGSPHLKGVYVNQLLSLGDTRSVEDFVSEVRAPLVTADRLVNFAFDRQDVGCFLLAMILKADYTWVFAVEESPPSLVMTPTGPPLVMMPMGPRLIDESLLATYDSYDEHVRRNFVAEGGDTCLWLAESGGNVYGLELRDGAFSKVYRVDNWDLAQMHEWLWREFADLFFDETVKERGQVRQYLEDDQRRDLEQVTSKLSFAEVNVRPSGGLMLVKDMTVSGMPHNLILDPDGEFISRRVPITCMPSAEWHIVNAAKHACLSQDFSTAMWIPTEGGDFALNLLWSRLESLADMQSVEVTHSEVPQLPLRSDINILSAHGASDISAFHAFSTREGAAVIDLDRIVSGGTVLVLLVCHSGSMGKDLLRNKILSLVRKFIGGGYQAVVAPFWSLHVSVPPVWLPEFLSSLKAGHTVSQAVFDANSKVYEMNNNPGAWACLHLYGNPYLKIKDVESL
jgi:hypothetical protein